MKLYLPCIECDLSDLNNIANFGEAEFNEVGYYEYTCPNGHKTCFLLQNLRFEILFEIGTFAFQDGYYRETVASYTAALERFYEFCINIFCLNKQIPQKYFEETWKISAISERQFGAFCFLYLISFGKYPTTKSEDDKLRKFRNNVIHNGYIPTRQEALDYGEKVFNFINKNIKLLKQNFKKEIEKYISDNLKQIGKRANKRNIKYTTMALGTLISTISDANMYEHKTFEEILNTHLYRASKVKKHFDSLKHNLP